MAEMGITNLDGWERRLDGAIRYVPYIALAVSTLLVVLDRHEPMVV